jgi:DNA polymerase-3 subunit gamma/tau
MAARVGSSATIGRESRQARKGATVTVTSGAGGVLARAAARVQAAEVRPPGVSMSYLVLARKWRPKSFAEMVGQEHVLRALVNALDSGRLHHAFLFTGTRGVGKTTLSRILAKSLNCEVGVSSRPCGACGACREIDEGRFVDLIEVDAASRTKVDDTRELLDNVQYMPTRGRYKVYLIDEVHMLSGHSFNALLKTLEEPPPHVKFLFATTDPQKLPVTVLSRCLQFNLKRLTPSLIAERMRRILDAEKLPYEPPAVALVAKAADGSMRDGLSLLDQLLAFGGGAVREPEARAMLGTIDRAQVEGLLDRLAAVDGAGLLARAAAMDEFAPDYAQVLDELALLLQRCALRQVVPDSPVGDEFAAEVVEDLSARLGPEDLQLYYQIAIQGKRDLDLAPEPRAGFEMVLLRMLAFRPVVGAAQPSSDTPPARPGGRAGGVAGVGPPVGSAPPGAGHSPVPPPAVPETLQLADWPAVVERLELQGAARQLASNCSFADRRGAVIVLRLDARSQQLRTKTQEDRLAAALGRLLQEDVRLEFELAAEVVQTPARQREREEQDRLDAAREALDRDPNVRLLKERFGGVVQADSVRPLR